MNKLMEYEISKKSQNHTMKILILLVMMNFLAFGVCGCSINMEGKKPNIVGYDNDGPIDTNEMTEIPFERIHYGATVIQYEDRFVFGEGLRRYEFPNLITTDEDWELLQKKLNLDLGEVDFEEYVVWSTFYFNLFDKVYCVPTYVSYMGYCDEKLYYTWNSSECVRFEAEDDTDRLCGFDILLIRRDDFPMEPRSVIGLSTNTGDRTEDNISVESHGSYIYE